MSSPRYFGLFAVGLIMALAGCTSASMEHPVGSGGKMGSSASTMPVTALAGGQVGDLKMVSALPPPPDTGNGEEALLSPGDTLQIDVFQVPDLSRTVQIDSSGAIALPLINSVQAAGKSVAALKAEIERLYATNYLQSPQVTVFVKDSVGQRVTVDGQVVKSGIYPVAAGSTLIQALAQAGGFGPIADPTKVYVFRNYGSQKLVANYNVTQIRNGAKPDPRIYGGDVIIVFTSSGKVAMQNLKDALGIVRLAAPAALL